MKTAHRRAARAKRQTQADFNAPLRVIEGSVPMTEEQQAEIVVPVQRALRALMEGDATSAQVITLADAINASLVIAEGIHESVEEVFQIAEAAVKRMDERHTKTGRWGLDGPGIREITDAVQLFEQVVRLQTKRQLELARQECYRRIRVVLNEQRVPAEVA